MDEPQVKQRLHLKDKWKVVARFTGYPRPKITWTKEGEPVDRSYEVKNEEFYSTITVSSVIRTQSGNYTVTATNDAGTVKKDLRLDVVGKFKALRKRLH